MASKKFPLGTTVYYIEQLTSLKDSASPICAEIEKNYEALTFANSDNQDGSKFKLLQALIHASGSLKTEGWIWKKHKVTDFNKSALKLLKDLVLIDASLWTLFKKKYHGPNLAAIKLDEHVLTDTNADALEFIQFLTMTPAYSNYVEYVINSDARKVVTDFLTKKEGRRYHCC
eukprot:TRINITY_DN8636_c0_g1_i1.p1 TRINITY_DN8636_c0_g1~~TRINITY_DN8636_c0_g1_i1.p1  ORF type:complete len:180 (-),score=25.86 TRINITY_DN8636_c0_g1_i1:454-972(-)